MAFFLRFFSNAIFLIFFDIGSILGGFGRPKWRPKSIFGKFFAMLFSSAFWNRFFCDFLVIFLYPNLDFCAHSQCFRAFLQNRHSRLKFKNLFKNQP